MWRTLLIAHRYLGVLVGALMVMWFASGIVMMYVGFPRVTEIERVRTLEPIAWSICCRSDIGSIVGDDQVLAAWIENLAGSPALTLRRPGKPDATLDLAHDAVVRVDPVQAKAIASEAALRVAGRPAAAAFAGQVQTDQWTVGRLIRDRPLFRFALDDPARTILYVSGTSGRVVHWTTASQRFWNWLGAVPHWLYFAELRADVVLWSEIVIWTALVGTFLTAIGLYIGISQLKLKSKGRISPYRGWFYWHHMMGLAFGIVTLTWIASGLISMNPWGFLESQRGGEQSRIAGQPIRWNIVRTSLDEIRAQPAVKESLRVAAAPFEGRLYWLVTGRDGEIARIDAAGQLAPLSAAELAGAAQRIGADAGIAEQGMIKNEDAYYFQRGDPLALPVYRVILGDEDATRYYLDPVSGSVLQRADANARWHRWLFGGLHRIDFTSWMRARPVWDIIVLFLMMGGLALAATGLYLAVRRVYNDLVFVVRAASKRAPAVHRTALKGDAGDA